MGFPHSSVGKESACNAGDLCLIPGSGRPLEKEMAIHSSILAWRITWTEDPGKLWSIWSWRVWQAWSAQVTFFFCTSDFAHQLWPSIHKTKPKAAKIYKKKKFFFQKRMVLEIQPGFRFWGCGYFCGCFLGSTVSIKQKKTPKLDPSSSSVPWAVYQQNSWDPKLWDLGPS